jgi:hypothetical protein
MAGRDAALECGAAARAGKAARFLAFRLDHAHRGIVNSQLGEGKRFCSDW